MNANDGNPFSRWLGHYQGVASQEPIEGILFRNAI